MLETGHIGKSKRQKLAVNTDTKQAEKPWKKN